MEAVHTSETIPENCHIHLLAIFFKTNGPIFVIFYSTYLEITIAVACV
jgi:hypothetical protein